MLPMRQSRGLEWLSTVTLLLLYAVNAEYDIGFGDDSDLTSFVTRPEIRAPRFNVTVYDSSRLDSGYWFVGVYADIVQQQQARAYYQACQTGPHIYDGEGNLVWSGACQFVNQNACDLRAYEFNGTSYLSTILHFYHGIQDSRGRAILMDNSYSVVDDFYAPAKTASFNMHEFIVGDNGNSAIYLMTRPDLADFTEFPQVKSPEMGWVHNAGFQEIDRATGETIFEWWAYPQVSLHEANVDVPEEMEAYSGWNFFHANSVDKSKDGHYIISSRYTDTIYKISGTNGTILWRLGGKQSDFELENFNFSRQHDARWIESTPDYDIISLLDNGGDGVYQTSNVTTGLVVVMDKRKMTARTIKQWTRPGNRSSALRGNFQMLKSGNVFGGWSDNGHISEHTAEGELLMEAEFSSERFVTYRSYKANFTSSPVTVPDMKAFAYGFGGDSSVTIYYVSWNGATEVTSWNFYRQSSAGDAVLLGNAKRTGFETRFQHMGFVDEEVFVEALDRGGQPLKRSQLVRIEAFLDKVQDSSSTTGDDTADPIGYPVTKTEL